MARLWGELKAYNSNHVKVTSRIAQDLLSVTLAVGKGSYREYTWERHVKADLKADGSVWIGVYEDDELKEQLSFGVLEVPAPRV